MAAILRLVGIFVVFLLALGAWLTLAGVTFHRTDDQSSSLSSSVAELYGGAHHQAAPTFTREWVERVEDVERVVDARGQESTVTRPRWETRTEATEPNATRIQVDLRLDERRKGLLWFPLYDVSFDGAWVLRHDLDVARQVRVRFEFPEAGGQYDDFAFLVDGVDTSRSLVQRNGGMEHVLQLEPGQETRIAIRYQSRGMTTWTYRPTQGTGQVEDFDLRMTTSFRNIDFPAGTVSPTTREDAGEGTALAWTFTRMVMSQGIGMVMPTHIQPGQLASELSLSAPIPLALFFLWVYVLGLLRGHELHPVNYLFLAAAFFAFNLLFAYTADRLPVEAAFGLASFVSVFLVVSYLRLVVGPRFAFVEAGLAQLAYQVGFGLAHFAEGLTGLAVTLLGIATLFAIMQMTGKIRWADVFATRGREAVPARGA